MTNNPPTTPRAARITRMAALLLSVLSLLASAAFTPERPALRTTSRVDFEVAPKKQRVLFAATRRVTGGGHFAHA